MSCFLKEMLRIFAKGLSIKISEDEKLFSLWRKGRG